MSSILKVRIPHVDFIILVYEIERNNFEEYHLNFIRMLKSRKAKLAIDKFPGEIIIVDFESGSYYSLRGSACIIWEQCESGIEKDDVIASFDNISGEQRNQITIFLNDLVKENLLEQVEHHSVKPTEKHNYEDILFEKYNDMEELIMLDPIHEVDERGWPHKKD